MSYFEIFYKITRDDTIQKATTWAKNAPDAIKKIIDAEVAHERVTSEQVRIISCTAVS